MMNANTQKRLGQYFSGPKVADLLSDMLELGQDISVIDPMAGTGDMLYAVEHKGCAPQNIYGIEIDPIAGNSCMSRMPLSKIQVADAFRSESILSFKRSAWDLVITNPPYVRYQSMDSFTDDKVLLQNAKEIRHNLINILKCLDHLTEDERACFLRIAQNYSGLSDLAVPAWILCAALVAPNGTLAMVVPEAWLSREYALSIKYLLLKFFDIQYIVEDQNSSWFPNVLVKTNLLVAKRVSFRKSFPFATDSMYKRIIIGSSCEDEDSLVGKIGFSECNGRIAFRALLNSDDNIIGNGFSMSILPVEGIITEMLHSQAFTKLYSKLERSSLPPITVSLPQNLCSAIGMNVICKLSDLNAWGFSIGQGLRTGANKFFYAESEDENGVYERLLLDEIFTNRHIYVQKKRLRPVLRYQADINKGLTIRTEFLKHRLLYVEDELSEADAELKEHILAAEKVSIISAGKPTHFQNLSAVKPNIRTAVSGARIIERHWYMLPELMPRHVPDLCMSRVNYKETKCLLLCNSDVVVDANFSTLWMDDLKYESVLAMFAILNSSWVKAYLETVSTVMGGGALKVEATHIRQLLLPEPTPESIERFSILGEALMNASDDELIDIVRKIDTYLLTQLFGYDALQVCVERLNAYLRQKVANRQR